MYASNENEDWLYLHGTSPINPILHKVVNMVDSEDCSSPSSSSSCSSNSSSSSQLDRSVSLSSMSSTELEHSHSENLIIQNDILLSSVHDLKNYQDLEEEIDLLEAKNDRNSSSIHVSDSSTQTSTSDNRLLSKKIVSQDTHNTNLNKIINISQVIKENETFNNGFNSKYLKHHSSASSESPSLSRNHRCQRCCTVEQTTKCEIVPSISMPKETKSEKKVQSCQHKNKTLISCMYIIVFLTLPLMLGHFITRWDQSTIIKIVDELVKTHPHLNNLKDIPIGNVRDKLTKQFEEKFQNMIHQQLLWHDHEKYTLSLQIQELEQILKIAQQNLTNTVQQLTEENDQLKGQIKSLEQRLGVDQGKDLKIVQTCIDGVNCTRSSLDKLVNNAFDHAVSITPNNLARLSNIFEYLSASFSSIIDHRREYVNKSTQKFIAITSSSAMKKVQTTFLRSLENFSSSLHKVKLTYSTWIKSYANNQHQNQMEHSDKEKRQPHTYRKSPVRWNFQYGFNQKQKWRQTNSKQYLCDSKFPMNKICSIKNWLAKLF